MNLADALDEGASGGAFNSGGGPWGESKTTRRGPWPEDPSGGGGAGGPWAKSGGGGGGAWPKSGGGGPWPNSGGGGGGGAWPKSGGGGPWPGGSSGGGGSMGQSGGQGGWSGGGGAAGGQYDSGPYGGGSQSGGGVFGGGNQPSGGVFGGGNQPGGGVFGGGNQPGGGVFGGGGGPKGGQSGGGWFGGGSSPAGPSPSPRRLSVPYRIDLTRGCYDGLVITIAGSIKPNPNKFTVDICSNSDIAFHFNPRFNENGCRVIVMNSCSNRKWDREQRSPKFPFAPGEPFEIKMYCTGDGFNVMVNKEKIETFKFRKTDRCSIKTINIHGDVTLTHVMVEPHP